MIILALDSSAKTCSAALLRDGRLAAAGYIDAGYTHSVALLPQIDRLLSSLGLRTGDIDLFAVTAGPGSFTGLRIGVATVKGLAWAAGKPCAALSTLEATAALRATEGRADVLMDARRGEFYHASFERRGKSLVRLTEDGARSARELLSAEPSGTGRSCLLGDGARLFYEEAERAGLAGRYELPELPGGGGLFLPIAVGAAYLAAALRKEEYLSAEALGARYLRLSQAERERAERLVAGSEA